MLNKKGKIFSGIQPTGNLHLGNYLGAIKQWTNLQNEYECIFCIVDLHAITVPQNPEELLNNTLEMTASYIASGINPDDCIIYNQSAVKEHTELAWILGCNTPLGWLNRMTQFKEKAGKKKDNAALGLYSYPVLMAADILLYQATHVPVGDDQKQHLELAREIAVSFNHNYKKEIFTIPEPMIIGEATRVMSLRNGKNKMSKSDESDNSRINLTDNADLIASKIRKAKADMDFDGIYYDIENRPEISNLLSIYAALEDISIDDVVKKVGNYTNSQFKEELTEIAVNKLSSITEEMNRLKSDKKYLKEVLFKGQQKAQEIAHSNISEVKDIVGLLSFNN